MRLHTSITYRLPGGMWGVYSGAPRPYWRWVSDTWVGGFALWRIWFRTACGLAVRGIMPWPSVVSAVAAADIKRWFDRFRAP